MRQDKMESYGKRRSIQQALDLIDKHQPRDPLELANLLGLRVVIRDLPNGICGLVADLWGVTIILISSGLPRPEQNYIAAHELYHYLDEHPRISWSRKDSGVSFTKPGPITSPVD